MKHTNFINESAFLLTDYRTYLFASIFTLGNVLLPQICHLLPHGGPMFLPIYFFTLIATCLMGWRVGILTAVISPIVNTLWFSMPTMAMLPVVLAKSVSLALLVGYFLRKTSAWLIVLGVLGAQIIGSLAEWLVYGDALLAITHVAWGIPGILIQILVGLFIVNKYYK